MEHTQQVSLEIEELTSLYLSMKVAWRIFLFTGTNIDLQAYEIARDLLPLKIKSLQTSTADNPRQQGKIKTLSMLLDEDIVAIAPSMVRKKSGWLADPPVSLVPGLNWRKIKHIAEAVQDEERVLFTQRTEELRRSTAQLVLTISSRS